MDGIAAVQARIQEIKSQFGLPTAGGVLGASDPNAAAASSSSDGTGSFADALS